MTFQPPTEQTPSKDYFSYSSMITAVPTAQENILIHGFASDGYPIYPDKINGHFLWDVLGSHMCDPAVHALKKKMMMTLTDSPDVKKRKVIRWNHANKGLLCLLMIQMIQLLWRSIRKVKAHSKGVSAKKHADKRLISLICSQFSLA